ncbi:MAG: DUF3124 domain-containing protein [Pirellulaceae bacterium]|nr:DUF3124 domain-containing protein [Pirellulaceae bacterium]
MKRETEYPAWMLWLWEKGPYLFIVSGLFVLLSIIGLFFYLNQRIDQVGDQLRYGKPANYERPDLTAYAVGDLDVAAHPVQQMVYVPVYSHVYYEGGLAFPLAATLSIRNTDPQRSVAVKSIKYFDTEGKLVESYLDQPIKLAALQTIEFLVVGQDISGGSGANFLVQWSSERGVNEPLVEAIMVGVDGPRGISFGRSGMKTPNAILSNSD